eukprot:GHVQ01006054.1.p1 GENE.GHVQ01006054.1~~GHVQ01006054.1.p1  ORF type:complete len:178 (-),score=26.76 GHVQ01006054.1:941-1474(-)
MRFPMPAPACMCVFVVCSCVLVTDKCPDYSDVDVCVALPCVPLPCMCIHNVWDITVSGAPDTSPTPASTAITSAPADATTPGPTTAGPTTAGPTTAGPTTAGPTTAGHTTAGPTTPGATTPGATTPDDSEYFCMHIDETLCVCVCVFCDSVVYTLHALLCVCKRVGYLFVSIYLWVL